MPETSKRERILQKEIVSNVNILKYLINEIQEVISSIKKKRTTAGRQ